ncbi:MAG: hypothetical protein CM15mV137_050 [uncultured marine virus]|nr:MAG: hypothetical protein CM15mV137_050 [uncultured marine virus]
MEMVVFIEIPKIQGGGPHLHEFTVKIKWIKRDGTNAFGTLTFDVGFGINQSAFGDSPFKKKNQNFFEIKIYFIKVARNYLSFKRAIN